MRGRGGYRQPPTPPPPPPPYNDSGIRAYPSPRQQQQQQQQHSYLKRNRDETETYPPPPPPAPPYPHPERHNSANSNSYDGGYRPPPPPVMMAGGVGLPPPPPPSPSRYDMYHAPQPTRFPPSAPLLPIRGDLPIEAICRIDLLAFYVAKAGPTVEEEIIHREEANPKFAFITARGSESDENAYYRWRLHSLLQGDTMTQWRTQPFQLERHPEAYVYVPPPALVPGPECLHDAYARLRAWLIQQSSGSGANMYDPSAPSPPAEAGLLGNAEEGDPAAAGPRYPCPSAYWLARAVTGEGNAFGTLSVEEAQLWDEMLQTSSIVEEAATNHPHHLEAAVEKASGALLSADAVAKKMIFAIEHSQLSLGGIGGAAPHVASLLLDAVVRAAYDAADVLTRLVMAQKQQQQQGKPGSSPTTTALLLTRLALLCVVQLSHLYVLHDVVQNAKAVPLLTEDDLRLAEAQLAQEDEAKRLARAAHSDGLNLPPTAAAKHGGEKKLHMPTPPSLTATTTSSSASATLFGGGVGGGLGLHALGLPAAALSKPTTSTRSLKVILGAIEAILPTVLEAITLTALAAIAVPEANPPSLASSSLRVTREYGLSLGNSGAISGMDGASTFLGGAEHHGYTISITKKKEEAAAGSSSTDGAGGHPADADANAEKTRRIGQTLLTWLSQFLCVWANRESVDSPITRGLEDNGRELISLRGRAMVLLLEKYEWLLPHVGR